MPPKKDTTKSSAIEPSEDETICREQLETLQLQLEEARAVAREDREWILERAREYEATAEDQREKVTKLQQILSQNYEHLERCTRDNAQLSDELLEKSREAEAARVAVIMAQGQLFNMRNQIPQQGISPPVSPMMHGTPHVQQVPMDSSLSVFQRSSRGAPSRVSSDVSLPRQMLFDGKSTWYGFIKPFILLSASCGWSQEEKLFQLTNSLSDEASEYAFGYLPNEALQSFDV